MDKLINGWGKGHVLGGREKRQEGRREGGKRGKGKGRGDGKLKKGGKGEEK